MSDFNKQYDGYEELEKRRIYQHVNAFQKTYPSDRKQIFDEEERRGRWIFTDNYPKPYGEDERNNKYEEVQQSIRRSQLDFINENITDNPKRLNSKLVNGDNSIFMTMFGNQKCMHSLDGPREKEDQLPISCYNYEQPKPQLNEVRRILDESYKKTYNDNLCGRLPRQTLHHPEYYQPNCHQGFNDYGPSFEANNQVNFEDENFGKVDLRDEIRHSYSALYDPHDYMATGELGKMNDEREYSYDTYDGDVLRYDYDDMMPENRDMEYVQSMPNLVHEPAVNQVQKFISTPEMIKQSYYPRPPSVVTTPPSSSNIDKRRHTRNNNRPKRKSRKNKRKGKKNRRRRNKPIQTIINSLDSKCTLLTSISQVVSSVNFSLDTEILVGKVTQRLDIAEITKFISRRNVDVGPNTSYSKPKLPLERLLRKPATENIRSEVSEEKLKTKQEIVSVENSPEQLDSSNEEKSEVSIINENIQGGLKKLDKVKSKGTHTIGHNIHKETTKQTSEIKKRKKSNNLKSLSKIKSNSPRKKEKTKKSSIRKTNIDDHQDSIESNEYKGRSYDRRDEARCAKQFRREKDLLLLIKSEYEKMEFLDTLMRDKQRLQRIHLDLDKRNTNYVKGDASKTRNGDSRKKSTPSRYDRSVTYDYRSSYDYDSDDTIGNDRCYEEFNLDLKKSRHCYKPNNKDPKNEMKSTQLNDYDKYSDDETTSINNGREFGRREFNNSQNTSYEYNTSFVIDTLDADEIYHDTWRHPVNQPISRSRFETEKMTESRRKNEQIISRYGGDDEFTELVGELNGLKIDENKINSDDAVAYLMNPSSAKLHEKFKRYQKENNVNQSERKNNPKDPDLVNIHDSVEYVGINGGRSRYDSYGGTQTTKTYMDNSNTSWIEGKGEEEEKDYIAYREEGFEFYDYDNNSESSCEDRNEYDDRGRCHQRHNREFYSEGESKSEEELDDYFTANEDVNERRYYR